MKNKCLAAIEQYNMLTHGDTVVVGVSGGADSMALLHFLHTHSSSLGISVIAAHFHHGIRGEEADRDQQFVYDYCKSNSIEFVTAKEDIPAISKQMRISIEECARNRRYAFLNSVSDKAKIATAHTNSDSCESFLFNFARGTGLQGLCGIPACRENIIRPLIFCSSHDTREYCSYHGIRWCEDSTNAMDVYSRNAIRMHIAPELQQINRRFEDNALRCMQILQLENDFLKQEADKAYAACTNGKAVLYADRLQNYHPAIQSRVLLLYARTNGCENVSMRQVERLLTLQNGDIITLNNAVRFVNRNNEICTLPDDDRVLPVEILIDEQTDVVAFCNSYVCFKQAPYNGGAIPNMQLCIDMDKISNPVLRTRQAGDRIRLKDRHCTKTIKQLFAEKKIPISQRSAWPVLSDKNGVIWIGGFGVDESRLADINTKKILRIEWRQTL